MGDLLKRLAALFAAIVMIVSAYLLRHSLHDTKSKSPGTSAHSRLLLCVPEAEQACRGAAHNGVTVTVEDAGVSAARLGAARTAQEALVDTWVAPEAWIAIMEDARTRNNLAPLFTTPKRVAQSGLVAVGAQTRLQAITKTCNGTLRWRCFGDVAIAGQWSAIGADAGWGRVKLGLPGPDSAEGPEFLGVATGDLLGRTNFDTLDLDDPATNFGAWLSALGTRREMSGGQAAVQRQLVTGSAAVDVVVTMKYQADAELSGAAGAKRLTEVAPTPDVSIVLSAASIKGVEIIDSDKLLQSLRNSGWDAAINTPTKLEAPTVLGALIDRWRQETT